MKEFVYARPDIEASVGSVEMMHVYRSKPFISEVEYWAPMARNLNVPWLLWVDDHHGRPTWDVDDLLVELDNRKLRPYGIYSEAALVPTALECIERFGNFDEGGETIPLMRKGVPTCAALAAAWTLVRLGEIGPPPGLCLWGKSVPKVSATMTAVRGHDVKAETDVSHVLSNWLKRL